MPIAANKLIIDGLWVLVGRTVTMLSGLLVTVFITRLLTTAEVGFYFLCFSLVAILSLVSQLGLNHAVVRLIAESLSVDRHEHAASVAALALRMVGRVVVIVSCLGLFFVLVRAPEAAVGQLLDMNVLISLVCWFSFQTMLGIATECLRGYHDVRGATFFGTTLPGLLSVMTMFILWSLVESASIDVVLMLLAGSVVLSSMLGLYRLRRKMATARGEDRAELSRLLSIAWPMWSTNITLLLLTQADIWIIGSFLTVDDVAVYGAATRLIVALSVSRMILNSVISPVIADLFARRQTVRLEQTLRSGTTLATLPSLLVMVVFYLAGEPLLELLYGSTYTEGYAILLILGAGQLFNVLCGPCGLVLLMTGYQRIMMIISIITSLLAIVASVYAAIYLGVRGVAGVFSAALFVQNVLMVYYARKYTGINTFMNFRLSVSAA